MSLEQILTYQNVIFVLAVMGVIEGIKRTLGAFKLMENKAILVLLPWLPMVFGAAGSLIPGVFGDATLGFKITLGIALGSLSGQVWKIFHTKLQLLQGTLK